MSRPIHTSELRDSFVAACKQAARDRKISLNRFFLNAEQYGLQTNWLRERYYGRSAITKGDLQEVRKILNGEMATLNGWSIRGRIHTAEEAIAAFCNACVGEDVACRFKNCELRRFSPYPYVKFEPSRDGYVDGQLDD